MELTPQGQPCCIVRIFEECNIQEPELLCTCDLIMFTFHLCKHSYMFELIDQPENLMLKPEQIQKIHAKY